jgi:hypothetical protein
MELHIPETVATPFVVATATPPHDPAALARARVGLPLAAGLLRTPLVRIHTLPAAESGYADLLGDAVWVRPEERHLLAKVTHHVIVTGDVPPVSQPDHGQALRAIARVVAEACDGVVYDAWSHHVLPHDFRFGAEHPEFCLADDWVATLVSGEEAPDDRGPRDGGPRDGGPRDGGPRDGGPRDGALRDGALRDGALRDGALRDREPREGEPRDGALRLVTAGLRRFALPELAAAEVPLGNAFAAVTLLRCLAVTLVSEHWDWLACNPGARTRPLRRHAWVAGRDVWRYWGAEPAGAVGGRVRIRLRHVAGRRPGTVPYLTIGPPADFDAASAEWWNDVVDLAMPYVSKAPRRMAA